MDERICIFAFSQSPRIGPKRFQNLVRVFGSAEKAWKGNLAGFEKAGIGKVNFAKFDSFRKTFNINEYLEKLKKARVEFINFSDEHYSARLRKIDAPPIGLFVKGNKKLLSSSPELGSGSQNTIAVVGARKITSYGSQVTSALVSELCSANFIIVSGMALGVDGAAHRSTIENRGSTIAVLGCGVDCPYPKENERLYEEILDSGGLIISEYWLGTRATRGTFPARNRIIAGISSAVLITEAAEDSGSLITAAHAIKQGKKVFAVPGPITSQMSRGTLKLLKQGAILASSADDILNELKVSFKDRSILGKDGPIQKVSKLEQIILEFLGGEGLTIDEITKATKIPITKLSIILSQMELSGLVKNTGGKFSASFI